MFDERQFLTDLGTFVRFKTCVDQNPEEFVKARAWIKAFFDPLKTEFVELTYGGFTNLLIKPRESRTPRLLGDGHIEVVPADDQLFELRRELGYLYGRGVADMKTQCLMMMWVLRELMAESAHNDFWLLFSEDEEIGSPNGVKRVVDYLDDRGWLPDVVFVPDGGHDFAYVEKEKGMLTFTAFMKGKAAHGRRPFLGQNAIDLTFDFYHRLKDHFPNPKAEVEWIPSLSMTKITAGEAFNKIPEWCRAGFDLRFTEAYTPDEIVTELEEIAAPFPVELTYHEIGMATYYPRERPVAQQYLSILRRVSGKEPQILQANGASNGRFYLAKKPAIQVLMTNPTVVELHAMGECLVAASLEPYYQLVRETALLS
jgi:succinyl-diaminopimelate desuccinylase